MQIIDGENDDLVGTLQLIEQIHQPCSDSHRVGARLGEHGGL